MRLWLRTTAVFFCDFILGMVVAGKVTSLKVQKKNRDRVSIFVDERFALGVPAIVAARLHLGQFLSDADLEALSKEGDEETAYNRVLDYLSYRPRSRREIEIYLQKRDVSQEQVERILARLERAGLLDDHSFARYWVENRERFRPRGERALRYELRRKGVPDDIVDKAVASIDESSSAYRAASNKARQLATYDYDTFRQKLIGYLARRGFSYDVARESVERHWAEVAPEGNEGPDQTPGDP